MGVIAEVDGSGRIYLPASIRRAVQSRRFLVHLEGDRIVLIPLKPAIEKYYGVAKPATYTSAEEIDRAVELETGKAIREDLR